jgi:asparagine synthase (glutamine-hydrolysing)
VSHHSDLIGVFSVTVQPVELPQRGTVVWRRDCIAFSDTAVWTDRSGEIVVAGEVLLDNGTELRASLSWPESQDGEILAELYAVHGEDVGLKARGMFAVAIWDSRLQTLQLLRDSVGCRTMYYGIKGGVWWFATRLAALERTVLADEISIDAIRDYLSYSYVPGSQTMWSRIKEVRPGTMVSLPGGASYSYWEPEESDRNATATLDECALDLRKDLEDVVTSVLPSNGPVGVFLSGGLDSSLVTAIVSKHASGPVHTYSIQFGSKYANELHYSELVARHCHTQHHVIEVTPESVVKNLHETMAVLDDPIGDPLTVPNLLLGRRAAHDVETIFNGEGGDPCFGGPKNHAMLIHQLYTESDSLESAYLRSYRKCYTDLDRLLTRGATSEDTLLSPFLSGTGMKSYLNRLMHINVRLKGADHILTKVNNLTRRSHLLAQSPLFDRRIVEASFAVPPAMKLRGAEEKIILKKAVADLLPEAILTRPKSGMMVPVNAWTRRELRPFVDAVLRGRSEAGNTDFLRPPIFRAHGEAPFGNRAQIWQFLNQEPVWNWLYSSSNARQGLKIWMVLSLELWLRSHQGYREA